MALDLTTAKRRARPASAPGAPGIDLSERGKTADGELQTLDRRLFMQLFAFGGCTDTAPLIDALEAAGLQAVLYEDVNDPRGIALLTFDEDPDYFIAKVRRFLNTGPFHSLTLKPELTMLGRTYSIGYEQDLEAVLLKNPRSRVCDPAWPWAVWYPLRRSGAFEQESAEAQRTMLMEHGGIGRSYGRAGLIKDLRLACHGLDQHDNDFIIGLLGQHLHPLSAIVQHMRRTRQTSAFLESLGPFFVGKAVWHATLPA